MWWIIAGVAYVLITLVIIGAGARKDARENGQDRVAQHNVEVATMDGFIWLWPVFVLFAVSAFPFFALGAGAHWLFLRLINVKPIPPKKERLEKQIIDAREHLRALEAEAELSQDDINEAAWHDFEAKNK